MHGSSLDAMEYFKETYLDKNKILKILDLGAQDINGCYKSLFENKLWIYHGADLQEGRNIDIVLDDDYHWKQIKDAEYDVFISGQTFEHIEFPWITIKEVNRILKPGGLLCIIAPMICPEHKFPVDCWRFLPDGMWALCKWGGFKVTEVLNGSDNKGLIVDTMLIAQKPL